VCQSVRGWFLVEAWHRCGIPQDHVIEEGRVLLPCLVFYASGQLRQEDVGGLGGTTFVD
jgi:hypothetical protein